MGLRRKKKCPGLAHNCEGFRARGHGDFCRPCFMKCMPWIRLMIVR